MSVWSVSCADISGIWYSASSRRCERISDTTFMYDVINRRAMKRTEIGASN